MNVAFLEPDSYEKDHVNTLSINFSESNPSSVSFMLSVDSDEKSWNISPDEYAKKKKLISLQIKDYLKDKWADILDKVDFVDMASPQTMKRYVNYYGGYGVMHRIDTANVLPITKIPGLFTIGQAVVSPGFIGAMISAFLLDKIYESKMSVQTK
jgi:phytoene dehydrogenase-like protein